MADGVLYVVATPLGNLDDLSSRAAEMLRQADVVACEDTRRTAPLVSRLGSTAEKISLHRFNEEQRVAALVARLQDGCRVALVSDSGTPGVSDPGARLVAAALAAGIRVVPLPGPSAVTTLLSASGLPADRYVFDGFLPHRGGERRRRLRELVAEPRTLVLFETPHRILDALADIAEIFGDRRLVLGRELTKVHETLIGGTADEIARALGDEVRGELTLAIAGAGTDGPPVEASAARLREVWQRCLEEAGGHRRRALDRAARELGMKKAELNRRLDELDASR